VENLFLGSVSLWLGVGMTGFDDPAFYGDSWADTYDDLHAAGDPARAAGFLAGLAGADGRVLELAIGTGRVALPLAARGVAVEGLDASRAMVDRMRAKPGGEAIPVTIGDMAEVPVTGPFRLVCVVGNSLFCLLSQDRQADCFRNVARVLEPGGLFVIECFVPDMGRFDRGQRVQAVAVTEDSVVLEASVHDAARQLITTQVVTMRAGGVQLRPVAVRYAWPSELDLMAGQAGLRLHGRYADWERRPFDAASGGCVSVYQRLSCRPMLVGCGSCRCCLRRPRSCTRSAWTTSWSASPSNATSRRPCAPRRRSSSAGGTPAA
jgi:SAM-dependent methyltransferase